MCRFKRRIVILGIIVGLASACIRDDSEAASISAHCPDYQIFEDQLITFIKVSTPPTKNKADMKCILTKVANDHQDDLKRDYLFFDYLWIELYFKEGDIRTPTPAARLRRHVPAPVRKEIPQEDQFYFGGE